jgi:hypothetical protein
MSPRRCSAPPLRGIAAATAEGVAARAVRPGSGSSIVPRSCVETRATSTLCQFRYVYSLRTLPCVLFTRRHSSTLSQAGESQRKDTLAWRRVSGDGNRRSTRRDCASSARGELGMSHLHGRHATVQVDVCYMQSCGVRALLILAASVPCVAV